MRPITLLPLLLAAIASVHCDGRAPDIMPTPMGTIRSYEEFLSYCDHDALCCRAPSDDAGCFLSRAVLGAHAVLCYRTLDAGQSDAAAAARSCACNAARIEDPGSVDELAHPRIRAVCCVPGQRGLDQWCGDAGADGG